MLGWSNPHAPDVMFQGEWIDEAFENLHRSIVHLQVELFAVSEHLDDAAELFLFSGELQRVAQPLRELLEEIFRPSVYRSASLFRGFYLSGRGPDREPVAMARDEAGVGPAWPISFTGDLLQRKVFPERGLALPLPGAAVARNRVSRTAQIAAVLLAMILTAGTIWSNARLKRVERSHESFFRAVGDALDRRAGAGGERSATVEERINQGYRLLEGVARLGVENFHSIFMPASIVSPIEPAVGQILQVTFGELILPDFRAGLEGKGRTVFGWNGEPEPEDEDDARTKPALADSAHYRALERFAADYRLYVDNYFRFVNLSSEESGSLDQLVAVGNYVTGHTALQRVDVPDEPYGRALRNATTQKVDCGPLAGLVERRARESLTRFGTTWFGDRNPVRASQERFIAEWTALVENGDADIRDLVDEVNTLSQSVSTWASIGARSGELRLPVLDQVPFKPIASQALCEELRPDLTNAIRQVAVLRDNLTPALLTSKAEPFGPLLDKGEKGLELGEGVRQLKAAFDDLATRDFRTALPMAEGDTVLPTRATWRPEALDHVIALFESFDRYRGGSFAQFVPAYRRPLVSALEADVASAVAARLAFDATEGEPLPADPAAFGAEIGRLGARLTKITRIMPLLESGDESFAKELERRLDAEAADALQRLERNAATRHPHIFTQQNDSLFAAWAEAQSGGGAPADVAKRWAGFVDEQRESIRRYAALAEPLVRFLTMTHGASLATRRWAGIVDDVSTFDQKIAGNGLGSLETFLRDGMPAIVPDKECGAGLGSSRFARPSFIGVRNELLDDVVKHCRDLARLGVQARYAAIAQSFNGLLATRFPFTIGLDGTRDAAPADVTEFLRVFDRQDGRALVAQLQSRACAEDATRFLRRIDSLYPLLSPARELPGGALALDVVPEFRVNREREIGGAQIAQWTLEVGKQTFHDGEAAKPARWVSGDPVQLTLRFAKDSPERPVPVTAASRRVLDRIVQMDFQGAWSLLSLLRAGHAAASDLVTSADSAPNTLRFEIPVERDPETRPVVAASATPPSPLFRVYVRVRVFQPGKQDPIAVDEFPVQAPPTVACSGM